MTFKTGEENVAKRQEVRDILRAQKIGNKNPQWKGGRVLTYSHANMDKSNPYVKIKKREHPYADSEGYVLEHRLIIEKDLGRHLTKDEVVHHKNGVKNDNRLVNLELFTKGDHTRLHMTGRIVTKETRETISRSWHKNPVGYGITHPPYMPTKNPKNWTAIKCKRCGRDRECYKSRIRIYCSEKCRINK